jgi:biotin synthase
MPPDSVNVSIGTAALLGLAGVPMADAPTTAYLMLGGRCLMDCAFCAQGRESHAGASQLSRVPWPEYGIEAVVEGVAQAVMRGAIRRVCLQVTVAASSLEQALAILRSVKAACDVPFDVAILPRDLHEVRRLLEAGADHIGFGLDAACERVFRQVKGGSWARSLALIEETARAYPGRAALHLIAGLGETERDLVERIEWAHDLGLTTGLFAFTPVRGTRLEKQPPPDLAAYRRMQAAHWLLTHDQARLEQMEFDAEGRLTRLGASLPSDGRPFETSGCPDCNRPYYNERPGGVIYNYPRPLTAEEAEQAIAEMGI